jgi:alpha-beta hydrolase superfamily lysophospholipase
LKDVASISLPQTTPSLSAYKQPVFEWMRGADGEELALRVWRGTKGMPSLLYLHGIEGHGEWFAHTAAVLNQCGMSVYVPDRRGAGLNEKARGHMRNHKNVLHDVELLLRRIGKEHDGENVILFGNCWGAKAASIIASTGYKTTDGQPLGVSLAGLILTCPALFTLVDLQILEKVQIALDVLRGDPTYLRETAIPIEPKMFTANQEFLDFVTADPLRLKTATSKFYFENFLLSLKAAAVAPRLHLPLLLIQSGDDQIVNVPKVMSWFDRVPQGGKSLKMFPDALHSIDFESLSFQQYTESVVAWISQLAVTA